MAHLLVTTSITTIGNRGTAAAIFAQQPSLLFMFVRFGVRLAPIVVIQAFSEGVSHEVVKRMTIPRLVDAHHGVIHCLPAESDIALGHPVVKFTQNIEARMDFVRLPFQSGHLGMANRPSFSIPRDRKVPPANTVWFGRWPRPPWVMMTPT